MITPADPESIPALVDLLNAGLGEGLFTEAELGRDLQDPTARVVAARTSRTLVGGALSRQLVARDVGYYEAFGETARRLFKPGLVGSISALAVTPAARRTGVGRRLVLDSLAWCRQRGCRQAMAISWISGTRDASAPLFAALGFTMGPTVPEFYLGESLRDGWSCAVCGGPCRCPGQLVHLQL